ncbi:protein NEN4-like [Triticum dicoccoides]|uniref:protein NEN4-like n=1 Tax=Triticum dicoccoides TaxID=85692 RepID=UPI00188E1C94|nr:protein NEN4-like [Triticum dicoccoides]
MATTKKREMVFFDVEAAQSPSPPGECRLLEFAATLVCPRRLVEVSSYSTLIRPDDVANDGSVHLPSSAPSFEDVFQDIFELLDGRVWAGHGIRRSGCLRVREAFAAFGLPAPEPVGVVDSLDVLLAQGSFGRAVAGDDGQDDEAASAALAEHFGIGARRARGLRCLDGARVSLEVLKHCAGVLLLESSLRGDVPAGASRRSTPAATPTPSSSNTLEKAFARASAKTTTPAKAATAPTPPSPAAASPAAVQKVSTSTGKRDSTGKVVVVVKKGATAATVTTTTATGGRRVRPPAPPFSMILRHSRAVIR